MRRGLDNRMTVDDFVSRIRRGERINCSNIQERNKCLILLDKLGFDIYNFDNDLDDIWSDCLYPGKSFFDDADDNEISCWHGLDSPFIAYKDVPFDECYTIQEYTKEEFDKEFKMLMGGA